ncbi:hypothetical protein N7539_005986 [Penicillium diatomitis]|uniref:Uncharacterized protein n=1 Tax=Penicillium diatomitis TaxID=2819901 RepID=A0A9W9X5U4_9EURO|nr:uncharacterized protein N7539_005986 [Penicillium diatomitis]KAJ5484190.1 hypothetical protein N7539_005986 [Penicillium diatomitis]
MCTFAIPTTGVAVLDTSTRDPVYDAIAAIRPVKVLVVYDRRLDRSPIGVIPDEDNQKMMPLTERALVDADASGLWTVAVDLNLPSEVPDVTVVDVGVPAVDREKGTGRCMELQYCTPRHDWKIKLAEASHKA